MKTVKKKQPIYKRMKEYLYTLIEINYNKPDFLLPSEHKLEILFNSSRICAKRALDELEKEGFIIRKKGKGSFISKELDLEKLKTAISRKPFNREYFLDLKHNIGFIVPDFNSIYMADLFNGLQKALENTSFNILVATSDYDTAREDQLIKQLVPKIDGLVIFPLNSDYYNKELLNLSLNLFPLIFIDNNLEKINATYITDNNFKNSLSATEYLIGKGHHKIALISSNPTNSTALKERIRGYEMALKNHNIPIDHNLRVEDLDYSNVDVWDIKIIKMFKKCNLDFTALFATDFSIGLRAIKILKEMNKDDIEIFMHGYEMNKFRFLFGENVHFIDQNPFEIGYNAGKALLEKIYNGKMNNENIVLNSQLY